MNKNFFDRLFFLIKEVYHVNLTLNIALLLKSYEHKEIDDLISRALFSIYKLLLSRNDTGIDERASKLWSVFSNEVYMRMNVNNTVKNQGKREMYKLPRIVSLYL